MLNVIIVDVADNQYRVIVLLDLMKNPIILNNIPIVIEVIMLKHSNDSSSEVSSKQLNILYTVLFVNS